MEGHRREENDLECLEFGTGRGLFHGRFFLAAESKRSKTSYIFDEDHGTLTTVGT